MERKYELNIDVRILELLGPNLYTNIYYVLAELIANAYDADARNVYILSYEDKIIVEDDGKGMSYEKGEVTKYLQVAAVSRRSEEDSKTEGLGRNKMGRKGVGKLAALSISEEVLVMTVSNGEKSGFVLTRHDQTLTGIPDDKIIFKRIEQNGTSIVMKDPSYSLHKTPSAVKRNLLKIFPAVNKDFQIHIIVNDHETDVLSSIDKEIGSQLCSCITLGDKSKDIKSSFIEDFPDSELFVEKEAVNLPLKLKNNNTGIMEDYNLTIEGWIGAYRSTRGRKIEASDFPDNFISLYANDKMGEFNILPVVGSNNLTEAFVVGQLYVDLFELSELDDMALSNRQGYRSDDPRYIAVINYVKKQLLPLITSKRISYAKAKKQKEEADKEKKYAEDELKFKEDVSAFKKSTSALAAQSIISQKPQSEEDIKRIVETAINDNSQLLGLKTQIEKQKKKLLISHTKTDKDIADLIYNMLLFNQVPPEVIIYTNCNDEICRVPEGLVVYEYLRKFFVESVSNEKMYVLFVTSENTPNSWGTMVEIGAAWVTQVDHKIFNINDFQPEEPLKVGPRWNNIQRTEDGTIVFEQVNFDDFCSKIELVSRFLGYQPKTRAENHNELKRYVLIK
jgi:hypothetical protein